MIDDVLDEALPGLAAIALEGTKAVGKLSDTINDADVRHLLWLREQLGDRLMDAVVLNTGPFAYRRPDGIAVVPLALMGP